MKVLVVEDDIQTIEAISFVFKLRWPQVDCISTTRGSEAALMVEKESPDVVMLDLGLPDISGLEALKEIRAFSNVPVIIVTARSDPMSQVKGLELGADDYIDKPFEPGVLLARIKSILRRANMRETSGGEEPLVYGDLVIEPSGHRVTRKGEPVALTSTEYNLLYQLVRNEGRVLTHQVLLNKVWGSDEYNSPDVVKKYIRRLREKLEDNPDDPVMLLSKWGVGYKFVTPPSGG